MLYWAIKILYYSNDTLSGQFTYMYSHNNLYNVEYLHCKLLVMYILFHRYIYEQAVQLHISLLKKQPILIFH